MSEGITVMISSTARDLPKHRAQVRDACLSQEMFPVMMEHLRASDADAIAESLAMADRTDIYLGIYAHRYGYVPAGHDISVTEWSTTAPSSVAYRAWSLPCIGTIPYGPRTWKRVQAQRG